MLFHCTGKIVGYASDFALTHFAPQLERYDATFSSLGMAQGI